MSFRTFVYSLVAALAVSVQAQDSKSPAAAASGMKALPGHLANAWKSLSPLGYLPATNELRLAISLPLRNPDELSALLAELYDPASANYRRYLTPEEFAARFGATEAEYQAVENFALTNGLRITERHPNRLVLDVAAPAAVIEKAFHVSLRTYRHPNDGREFFAPDSDPTVSVRLPLLQVSGLNNYAIPQPRFRRDTNALSAKAIPRAGTGPGSTYIAKDLLKAYLPGMTNLTGTGQSVGLLQFDGYYTNDIQSYINTAGITTSAKLINVAVDGGVKKPGSGNGEVALDIQMVLALAPGVSNIYVYEAPNPSPWVDLLSRMANDNKARQLSCSWGDNSAGAPDMASEQIFLQMAAQGQSFFNASGDSDAFTSGIPFPSESTNITQVGATTLTTGSGASYTSEQVWNWGITRGSSYDGVGSSGGISLNFALPWWQQGMTNNLNAAAGSLTRRNVPDVSFIGDNVYSICDNGASAGATAGTSCAAPLWAAFMALVNQQNAANGQPPAGFINPSVYAIGNSLNYNACFHDTVISSNTWSSSTTKYRAVTGFDLCTGWGTPNGTNLINALAPPASGPAQIVSSPASRTNTLGATVTFQVGATGALPLAYQWYFTNALPGATNATLVLSNVSPANAGGYYAVVTNSFGSDTSAVAFLTVTLAPSVLGFSPSFGIANDSVSISGLLFSNVTSVSFNGVPAAYSVNSATSITATVPAGAGSGPISVTTVNGTATSSNSFVVLAGSGAPVVAFFTPGTGVTNSFVTLTGTNFVNLSGVGFNGVSAEYTADSMSQITARVPFGATDGVISVTNSYGVGASATAFTVATNPVSPVNISQIFGGGGLSGAPYQYDYIELYNRSGAPVDLGAWSVQYAASSGSSWSKINLSGILQPAHHFLIQCAGGGSGAPLPTPDVIGGINLSSTKGKVALLSSQTTISSGTSSPIGMPALEDFVGYGSANAYEGSGPAPTLSATTAALRAGNGTVDTGDNAADFTAGAPNPRNSGGVVTNQPPSVTTSPATGVVTNGATLNGSLNPNGQATTAWFEYGLTTAYGSVIPLPGAFTGSAGVAVSTNLTGLTPGTTYHFRLDATNATGSTLGADQSFTTPSGSGGGTYTGVLAGWDTSGSTTYGASPQPPTTNAPNVAVVGLTRGSGLATAGTPAARTWGGNGWSQTMAAVGISGHQYVTFSLTVTNGGALTISSITRFDYKRSSNGPANGLLQYQVGDGAFVDITNFNFTSTSGASLGPIDLSGISALQNIAAGTTVTFRLVGYNATSTGGNWYIFDLANSTALDFSVSGAIASPVIGTAPVITAQPADTNVFAGKTAGFTVTATGTPPLAYQWRRDGAAVTDNAVYSGSTNLALLLLSPTTNYTGGYSVVVSNALGSVTSRLAALTVTPLPQVYLGSSNGSLVVGISGGAISNVVVLQIATNLAPPVSWSSMQTNIVNASGQVYFTPPGTGPAGFYRLLIP
jgi:hypothetical protein